MLAALLCLATTSLAYRPASSTVCPDTSLWAHGGTSAAGFKFLNTSGPDACCSECEKESRCDYVVFIHSVAVEEPEKGNCHLKSGSWDKTNGQKDTITSPVAPPAPPSPVPTPPPSVAPVDAPNILLLFPDQWRFDWDGFPRDNQPDVPAGLLRVPTTRRVAASGTRFTTAYVPAPVCAPSRSCLASGREYDAAGVLSNGANDYPINQTTFYAVLRSGGYHVMTTGKDDLTKKSQLGSKLSPPYPGCSDCVDGDGRWHLKELGFSDALRYSGKFDVVQKPDPHEMYGFFLRNHSVELSNGTKITAWDAHRACIKNKHDEPQPLCVNTTFTAELYEDDYTAANAVTLLNRAPKDKPWFLHVSFPGPHDPFLVTEDMHNAASDGRNWPNATDDPNKGTPGGVCARFDAPSGNRTRCNYAAEIENLDRLFGIILAQVEKMDPGLNKTVVCLASDHGEMLGDHGDVDKSKPWEGSAHVPLICMGPGIKSGATVTYPVATMDMAGTFMDFAGVSPAPGMTTKSFRPLLEGKSVNQSNYRPYVSSGLSNFRMVVWEDPDSQRQWKYICCKGQCPNPPSTAPKPKTPDSFVDMLIDIVADPYDMKDISSDHKDVVKTLQKLLPPEYAEGCTALRH